MNKLTIIMVICLVAFVFTVQSCDRVCSSNGGVRNGRCYYHCGGGCGWDGSHHQGQFLTGLSGAGHDCQPEGGSGVSCVAGGDFGGVKKPVVHLPKYGHEILSNVLEGFSTNTTLRSLFMYDIYYMGARFEDEADLQLKWDPSTSTYIDTTQALKYYHLDICTLDLKWLNLSSKLHYITFLEADDQETALLSNNCVIEQVEIEADHKLEFNGLVGSNSFLKNDK
eukprot:gene5700-6584_t